MSPTPLARLGQWRRASEHPGARQQRSDVALLLVRVALAWVFIYHGAGTLFGAFHGAGLKGEATFFTNVAHLRPGLFFATLSGLLEFLGGVAVGLGLVGRLAALGLFGDMVVAMITVTFKNGLVSSQPGGGYELNLALAGLAVAVVLLGSGRGSVDHLLRTRRRRLI